MKKENQKDNSHYFKVSQLKDDEYRNFLNIQNYGRFDNSFNLKKYGSNQIASIKFNYVNEFAKSIIEPFNLLLLSIGVIELIILIRGGGLSEALGLGLVIFMLLLATTIDFLQKVKSYKINKKLHNLIQNKYRVLKDETGLIDFSNLNKNSVIPNLSDINESDILVGDTLFLTSGDVVPCDSRIIWSDNLMVSMAVLNGESEPVFRDNVINDAKYIFEINNILFAQSSIVNGHCLVSVFKNGTNNYSNQILSDSLENSLSTDYDKGIKKVTLNVFIIICFAFAIILISTGLKTGNWFNSFIMSISVVVALTPESLPTIISGNLQKGSSKLSKSNVVVKNFKIIQNLGTVEVFASDKTGTLTEDHLIVKDYISLDGNSNPDILNKAFIGSYFQSTTWNSIDKSILLKSKELNFSIGETLLIDEIEFNFQTRHSTVRVLQNNKKIIISKGSVEEMLGKVSYFKCGNQIKKITQSELNLIEDTINSNAKNANKLLLVAYKESTKEEIDDNDLIIEGLIIFENIFKQGVNKVINEINDLGIEMKILTGDSLEVSKVIFEKLGINNKGSIDGADFRKLGNEELIKICNQFTIFSKLDPYEKGDVIRILKQSNRPTSYMGDGINDAIALSNADVGIAVKNSTNTAKQAADIIMLDDDISALKNAFIDGRKTFTNAFKFIKITVATNLGLMMSLVLSSFIFSFNAMTSSQLLIQNLIFDFSNIIYIYDNVDDVSIKKPMKWNTKTILPFGLLNGLTATIVSCLNFLIMYFFLKMGQHIDSGDLNYIERFQTTYFIESFITHMILIVILRTEKISILKSNPNYKVTITLFALIGFIIGITHVNFFDDVFMFSPPEPIWWIYMLGLVIFTWCIGELFKFIYIKIFKNWF